MQQGVLLAVKILLVDDHDLFREGLKLLLNKLDQEIELIEAESFDQAIRVVEDTADVDLILLDLKMPGVKGMDGLVDMRARAADTPIVIMSGAYAQSDIAQAFQHGAAGFIPKTMSSRAMYSALNLVLSGERYIPSAAFLDGEIRTDDATATADDPFRALTRREREVLALLVDGLSNRQIAERLQLQEVSVRARLTGLFKKLGVHNRTQAASLAIREGYRG